MRLETLVNAVLIAAAMAAASGPVLRRLPEPADDPDAEEKTPYAALASPRFAALVALLAGASSLLAFNSVPPSHWLAWAALSAPGALAIAIDGATTWIPRYLTLAVGLIAAAGVVLAWALTGDAGVPLRALLGTVLVGGFFWLMWRLTGGVGFADVRLMAAVGCVTAATSAQLAMAAVLVGTLLGAVWGIASRVRRGAIPFAYGPSLWAGPFLALLLLPMIG